MNCHLQRAFQADHRVVHPFRPGHDFLGGIPTSDPVRLASLVDRITESERFAIEFG